MRFARAGQAQSNDYRFGEPPARLKR